MGMVDQSLVFWDLAVEVAKRSGVDEARLRKLRSAQLMRSLAAKTPFTLAAVELAATISEVTHLIKTQRQDYVQPGRLTQNQQDAVESQVGGSLKRCQENIQRLQGLIKGPGGTQSGVNTATIAHRQGVALILTETLQTTNEIFNEAREQRHQQQLHQQQQQQRKKRRYTPSAQTLGYQSMPTEESANLSQHAEGQQELMQTEGENRLLRHRLSTHRDQATGIESSLAEVAQLTEVFTQQVMQQSKQIELLYSEAVAQTANIEKGNVQLKKAMKLSTSARKYTAVLMVVASLLVLGFDWYAS